MEQSKSSRKVTVEYTDPSGIYTVISEDLQKRLPLRNLYWNSATRPLRSISSLHIELVQTGSSTSSSDPSERVNSAGRHGDAENAEDRDISRDNRPGSGVGVKKERRHQIPGLRQTPYLKIFFLRCSDVESYRATYRKQIREWIKGNTPPTQSTASVNTQEFHDAFEWLIVHVVLPDDGRSISRASTSKSENRNGLGGSSAVVEKLRADFNGSSKNAVDRVSLVQITRGPQPGQSQVSSDGWEDFIAKTKSLILSSFDLRVTQYEEDIKEREAQRNIPGWNFNTFFVLKEGLARGFESIGLVEDALNGYRELAVGLNTVIEGRDDKEQHREHFKHFTDDLSATLKNALQSEESHIGVDRQTVTTNSVTHDRNGRENRHILGANILDADKKPFREMILANEISVFDFQCYLFAREASLLLRLANATVPSDDDGSASGAPSDIPSKAASSESQNLLLLAEVCRQAIEFFSAAGRMIRDDLRSSVHPLSKGHTSGSPTTLTIFDGPIEDIIASWTYSACQCILDATNVLSLQTQLQPLLRSLKPTEEGHAHANNYFGPSTREELPRRISSLPKSTHASPKPLSPDEFPSITSLDAVRLLPPVSSQTGTQELAAQHAELVIMKRRIMVSVGDRSTDTSIKRAILAGRLSLSASDLEDISLDDTSSQYGRPEGSAKVSHGSAANGIQGIELNQNLRSESSFRQAYEELTVMALALNVLGGRRRSAESLTRDLAVIRYRLQDYISAASYFRQLSSFYYNNDWTRLEVPMLDLFAKCLKHINRLEDFCRTGLQIVSKTTSRPTLLPTPTELRFQNGPLNVDQYLQEVINISRSLERPVSTPLHLHFEGVHLDPYIRHLDEEDGFRMSLEVRNIMSAAVEAQGIRVKLVSIEEEQRCDIWITNQGPVLLQTGLNVIILQSTVMCPAWYRVERIEIQSANIVFTHDATSEASFDGLASSDGNPQLNSTHVLVWPDEKALEARLSLCKSIYLRKPRSIEILISSGRNKVSHGKLSVRACSAGLRLQTAETDVVSRNCLILQKAQAGNIEFGALDAQSNTIFRVPYSIESDLLKIKVRVEVSYTVEGQAYQYSCIGELPIQLPLSVNVQDSFQERSLFSNFKIDTANSVPMRIGDYRMDSTQAYQVALPPLCSAPLTIFARQPLSLVAKIRQGRSETVNTQTSLPPDRMLMLRIKYACVEHEISAAVDDALTEALLKSEFTDLSRLLVTVLGKSLRSSLSLQDLETVGLLGEIQTSSFEQQLWQPVLNGLHPDRREKVAKWLTNWQAENSAIALPQAIDSRNVLELMVPFEIPEIPIVVTGRLETFNCGGGPGEGRFAAMDHSLLAELSLSYSRHWSKSTDVGSENYALNITYEVHASPEIWLIGGQRKGHFSAKEGEVSRFPIILLPQKTGHLLYPSVEVHATKTGGSHRQSKDGEVEPADIVACEMDYVDQGDSILIVRDLSSSTVSLESSGPGGGAWLVESRSRSER